MNRTAIVVVLLLVALPASAATAAEVGITPAAPADMTVNVAAGEATLPGGKTVKFQAARLEFDPPEIRDYKLDAKAPVNYAPWMEGWGAWPDKDYKTNQRFTINLVPHTDEEGTLILGCPYRLVPADSVVVTSADGRKTFKMNEDYKYNPDFGQVVNLNDRLGEANKADLKVAWKCGLQRLDLIQVGPQGQLSVKKGKSVLVCPELPAPDVGWAGLAGIYVVGRKAADNPNYAGVGRLHAATPYAISTHEIFPFHPEPPVEPINKGALARSVAKLSAGKELKIAFLGASVTVGAETPQWWDNLWTEKNLGFPSHVVVALRKRLPKATVTPIAAFRGGTQTKYGLEMIDKTIIPAKADLVLIDFGGNDASGPVGQPPNNPPEKFKEDMRAMIRKAKGAGMDVLIVVGWGNIHGRWGSYRRAMLDVAQEENVAAADVCTEFDNLASRGIPPASQLHNWGNHPGAAGHKIWADVILRCFDIASP